MSALFLVPYIPTRVDKTETTNLDAGAFDKKYREKGLGKQLMNEVHAYGKNRGSLYMDV